MTRMLVGCKECIATGESDENMETTSFLEVTLGLDDIMVRCRMHEVTLCYLKLVDPLIHIVTPNAALGFQLIERKASDD